MYFPQCSRALTCLAAADSMVLLADVYTKLTRHDDALQLCNSALQIRRRVLPHNHSSIGTLHVTAAFMPPVTQISQENQ